MGKVLIAALKHNLLLTILCRIECVWLVFHLFLLCAEIGLFLRDTAGCLHVDITVHKVNDDQNVDVFVWFNGE